MKLFAIDTNIYIDYIVKGLSCFSKLVNHYFKLFENKECTLYVPSICFWEITRKIYSGKLKIENKSPEDSLLIIQRPFNEVENIRDLLLTRKAASLAPTFSNKLSDPFDQLIVASAMEANLPLITKDKNIQESKLIRTVW